MAFAVMLLVLPAHSVLAQAWLPPQGEGSISLLYQDVLIKDHYFTTTPIDRGHIQGNTLLADLTYGVTDRFAVTVSIPWVTSAYTGNFPHPLASDLLAGVSPARANPIDNGTYHSTFQDFHFDVRYNVTKRGVVLTPFVGSIVPSHDYAYFAHAAAGRDLSEIQVGFFASKLLDSLVPGLFVQGRYSYGFTEQVLDISHNRSNMDFEVGYFVAPRLRVLALTTGQVTHGGIDLAPPACQTCPIPPLPALLLAHHDQISRDNLLNLGGGVSYALGERIDLFGSMIHTVAARNGHAIDQGLSFGLSWSFSTARAHQRSIASSDRSLAKCLCEKKTS
jgi:hypothetical protein